MTAWHSGSFGSTSVQWPARWTPLATGSPADGTLVMDVPDGNFAPTLVITSNAYAGTVEAFSTIALTTNMTVLAGHHLLAVDEAAGGRGRRYEFLHDQDGITLHCVQLTVLRHGVGVSVTATCAEYQFPAMDAVFRRMLDSVAVRPPADPSALPPLPFTPGREPRLQEFTSVRAGRPFEELSGIAATQPYRSTGPWLAPAELRLLQRFGESPGALGRLELGSLAGPLSTLVDAGLATPSGRLTEQGRTFTAPLGRPTAAFRIQTQVAGRTSILQLWFGSNAECMVLAGPAAHEQRHASPDVAELTDRQQGDLIPAAAAAATVAQWLGIGPSWPLAGGAARIPGALYAARLAGMTDAPADLEPALVHAWLQPWLLWSVEGTGLAAPVSYIDAGPAGLLRTGVERGRALLEPTASRNVYRHLAAILAPRERDRKLAPAHWARGGPA